MGHPLDPIGTLFSTLMETGRGSEEGATTLLDFSGTDTKITRKNSHIQNPTLVKVLELPKLKILVSAENQPETVILCDVIRLILMYQSVSSVNI